MFGHGNDPDRFAVANHDGSLRVSFVALVCGRNCSAKHRPPSSGGKFPTATALASRPAPDALAGDVCKILDRGERNAPVLRLAYDGPAQRMLRHLLETRRDAKNVIIVDAGLGRENPSDGRPAFGQRSRLVENDHVDLASALQRLAVFDEDAAARTDAGTHHDRRRRPRPSTTLGRR